jgi:hypothetical protein
MHLQPWPAVSDQQIFQHKNHHTRPSVKHGLMASVQRDIHQRASLPCTLTVPVRLPINDPTARASDSEISDP